MRYGSGTSTVSRVLVLVKSTINRRLSRDNIFIYHCSHSLRLYF